MKYYSKLMLCIFCAAICHLCSCGIIHAQTRHVSRISMDSLKRHTSVLGSDNFLGRAPGQSGSELAARYIKSVLTSYGLTPVIQQVPMHSSRVSGSSRLTINSGNSAYELRAGIDYLLNKYGAQTFIPVPAPLVFAGYGIIAPEFDYNSYQNIDVRGKIVVILSGEPSSFDNSYFAGKYSTVHASNETKQRVAFSRGALGSIIIDTELILHNAVERNRKWSKMMREYSFPNISLAYSVTTSFSIVIKPALLPLLFNGSNQTFDEVLKSVHKNTLCSFPLNSSLSFNGVFSEKDFISENIFIQIKGTDEKLRNSYLTVTAHYDHLGIGIPVEDDSVYNGVCDNALGVSVLLELARIFSKDPAGRSMLFIFFTGEESGLAGSSYYTSHPAVPLGKTAANINIDGICFLDKMKSIRGVGCEYSTLEDVLAKTAGAFGLAADDSKSGYYEPFFASDHFSFAKAGIPSILISEGGLYENYTEQEAFDYLKHWMDNVYHSPFDDLSQNISFDAVLMHAEIIEYFCRLTADTPAAPEWNENSPFYKISSERQ